MLHRVNGCYFAIRTEYLLLTMRITKRPLEESISNIGISLLLSAFHGLHKFRMISLPFIKRGDGYLKEISKFVVCRA